MKLFLYTLSAGAILMLADGCSSSESTEKAEQVPPADTATVKSPPVPPPPQRSSRRQVGFVTQEDTIEATVVTKKRGSPKTSGSAKKSINEKYYSVQVGAFKVPSNADRCRKQLKERYKKPVYHFYDKAIKMYRVTVGRFTERKEAFAFLKELKKGYPKEYSSAWVAEMGR